MTAMWRKDYIVVQYDVDNDEILFVKSFPDSTIREIVEAMDYSPFTYHIFIDGHSILPKKNGKEFTVTNRFLVHDEDFIYSQYTCEDFAEKEIESKSLHNGTKRFFMTTKYDKISESLSKLTDVEIDIVKKIASGEITNVT